MVDLMTPVNQRGLLQRIPENMFSPIGVASTIAVLLPVINFVLLDKYGAWPGPPGVRVDSDAVNLGWRISLVASAGTLAGIWLASFRRGLEGRPVSLDFKTFSSRNRTSTVLVCALVVTAYRYMLTVQSSLGDPALRSQQGLGQFGAIPTILFFVAPPTATVAATYLACRAQVKHAGRPSRVALGAFVLFALAVLPGLVYSFNRAAVVFPLTALVAVGARLGIRVRWRSLVLGTLSIGFLFFGLVLLRNINNENQIGNIADPNENFQIYSSGPQFVASAANTLSNVPSYGAWSFARSLVSPIPILGEPHRLENSSRLYNRAIYEGGDNLDQLVPVPAEMWVLGGQGAVFLIFVANGVIVTILSRRARLAVSPGAVYLNTLGGIWLAFAPITSASSISQGMMAFVLPSCVAVRLLERRLVR